MVTTPQAAAADVAERAGAIATQTGQTVAGRHREHVLPGNCPTAGGWTCSAAAAARCSPNGSAPTGTDVPLLGQIPLDISLREGGDSGRPIVLGGPDTPAAAALSGIAGRTCGQAAGTGRDEAGRPAPLIVQGLRLRGG